VLWLIGWANYGLGKYEDAIPFFQRIRIEDPKKIEVLNILADTYYQMDERAKSLEIVQQSLALKPDQKDILELKKKLESQQ
jgi:tetratricopeptide (TPR) repeat protein